MIRVTQLLMPAMIAILVASLGACSEATPSEPHIRRDLLVGDRIQSAQEAKQALGQVDIRDLIVNDRQHINAHAVEISVTYTVMDGESGRRLDRNLFYKKSARSWTLVAVCPSSSKAYCQALHQRLEQ